MGAKELKLSPPSEAFNTLPTSSRSICINANFSGTFRKCRRRFCSIGCRVPSEIFGGAFKDWVRKGARSSNCLGGECGSARSHPFYMYLDNWQPKMVFFLGWEHFTHFDRDDFECAAARTSIFFRSSYVCDSVRIALFSDSKLAKGLRLQRQIECLPRKFLTIFVRD